MKGRLKAAFKRIRVVTPVCSMHGQWTRLLRHGSASRRDSYFSIAQGRTRTTTGKARQPQAGGLIGAGGTMSKQTGAALCIKKTKRNRSEITPDQGGHRPQRPCAQGGSLQPVSVVITDNNSARNSVRPKQRCCWNSPVYVRVHACLRYGNHKCQVAGA